MVGLPLFGPRSRGRPPGGAGFERLFEIAPNGQLILDPEHRIVRVNPAARGMLNRPNERLVGHLLAEFVAPASVDRLAEALSTASTSGAPTAPVALEGMAVDGGVAPWELVAARSPEGSPGHLLVVLVDRASRDRLVAALAERGAQLSRSNRDLQEFTHAASHDLQEPLRMISSYTELVERRYRGRLDAEAEEFLTFAREGAVRLQRLLDDLLSYSRIDSQGHPFVPFSMNDSLAAALANLRVAVTESEASVDVGDLPEVEGDAVQMIQLFQNLVGNALKFRGAAPPRIVVRGQVDGPDVEYSVADNGLGIPPEYREKVFVIFQRLHRREEYPGTGLGLAICKRIVERHGGTIWVEGAPSTGSTFRFRLPRTHVAPPVVPEPADLLAARFDSRREAEDLIQRRLQELV